MRTESEPRRWQPREQEPQTDQQRAQDVVDYGDFHGWTPAEIFAELVEEVGPVLAEQAAVEHELGAFVVARERAA